MNIRKSNKKATIPVSHLRYSVLAVDAVIFSIIKGKLSVFTITTNIHSYYKDTPALPGGVILNNETAEEALIRHLKEKTNIKPIHIEQLYTFSDLKRDPRNRVVSIAYMCIVPESESFSDMGIWRDIKSDTIFAFDHIQILKFAYKRLKSKVLYSNIIKYFLPSEFTLSELKKIYEIVIGRAFDKRNFMAKIKELNIISSTGKIKRGQPHRPAQIFSFKKDLVVFDNPFKD